MCRFIVHLCLRITMNVRQRRTVVIVCSACNLFWKYIKHGFQMLPTHIYVHYTATKHNGQCYLLELMKLELIYMYYLHSTMCPAHVSYLVCYCLNWGVKKQSRWTRNTKSMLDVIR